jgi:diguanylate cyclase (GGDEF)-like protein
MKSAILMFVTCIGQSIFMSVHDGEQARFVYSIMLPIVLLGQIALIETFLVTFKLSKPRWYPVLWGVGITFLSVSIVFHRDIYPVLQQVPDGYFFASPPSAVGFTVLKSFVFGSTLIGLVYVVVCGLKKVSSRNRWPYALVVLLYGLCLFNDSIVLQRHRTLYPTTWVGALLLFGMLCREIRWHMQDVYSQINVDRLTGAYSRSYGEFYLSKLLAEQDVGIFYADIDDFKGINDAFGHQAGDQALKLLADLVSPMMYKPNALVRLGGDEFLFIFPNAESDDESHLHKELYSLLDGMLTLKDENDVIIATLQVSFGWAHAKRGSSWIEVIHRADLSMYQQKGAKKNGTRHR